MWNKNAIKYFRTVLLEWFAANKRDFPWRKEGITNYELIFSEILLQRTKAETVAKYYDTFFKKFPDWNDLVLATNEELISVFKPLGLHTQRVGRIRRIIDEYKNKGGIMPRNKNELQESSLASLYISNAYELLILNKKAALLDVNMSRVLSRFFYPKEFEDVRNDKIIQEIAHNVISVKDCKELNWAILDFAAAICKAKTPKCAECGLSSKCRFYSLMNKTENIEEPQLSIKYDSEIQMNPGKQLKVVSLFSGCGGMDLGFEGDFIVHKDCINENQNPDFISENLDNDYVRLQPTRFQTVFANDILVEARNAWVNYFKKRKYSSEVYHVESIVDLVKMHRDGHKVFPDKVDIVTGGFPCQDFSVAGKRKGLNSHKDHTGKIINNDIPSIETRGQLYMWMKEVVELTRPKVFVAENVKGLVNLLNVKEIIQNDFSEINGNGYLVLDPLVLHAANFGVPQSRERVIFIGIKKSELNSIALEELSKKSIDEKYFPYPKPSHSYNAKGNKLKKPVKLETIFKGLPEPELADDPSQRYYSQAKFMGKHCQGQTEVNMHSIGPTIRAEHHGNIEFRRLSIENGGKQTDEIIKMGFKQRRLTPRECALIQTFPPDYEFVIPTNKARFFISTSSAYKIIGNAVPPLLAYHIAKRIELLWDLYFKKQKNGNISKFNTKQGEVSITAE